MKAPCETLHELLRDTSITSEERRTAIVRLSDIEDCVLFGLRDAADREDWLVFNQYLIVAYHRPDRRITPILSGVLTRRLPQVNNEDLVSVLGETGDATAVAALGQALRWHPDWDEFHGLAVKCVWAIAAIGGPDATVLLQEAAGSGPERVRMEANEALTRPSGGSR